MEHSKLPWKKDEYVNETAFCILSLDNSFIAESIRNEANAAFIIQACNEYDTLKAKADLFDEMVDQLGKSTCVISLSGHDGTTLVTRNQELLLKAKGVLIPK